MQSTIKKILFLLLALACPLQGQAGDIAQDPKQLAEDIQTYGEQIKGLSYQDVREALLSERVGDRICDVGINPKKADIPHAYDPHILTWRIFYSTASEAEKEKLWNLFLYIKMAYYIRYPNVFNSLNRIRHTPATLYSRGWDAVATATKGAKELSLMVFGGGTVLGLANYVVAKRQNKAPETQSYILGTCAFEALFLTLVGCECLFRHIFPGPNDEEIEYFENIEINHFKTIEWLKDYIPQSIVNAAYTQQQELFKLSYRSDEKGIDYKILKQHQKALLDYYIELGKRADVEGVPT